MTAEGIRKVFLVPVLLLTLASLVRCYPVLKEEARRPEDGLRQVRFFPLYFVTTWIVNH